MNRVEEAQATVGEAQAKKLDSPFVVYLLAFVQNDAAEMKQQVARLEGEPGLEYSQ